MATDKPRVLVTITDEMQAEINDYRFEHRYETFSAAVRSLIEIGLRSCQQADALSRTAIADLEKRVDTRIRQEQEKRGEA